MLLESMVFIDDQYRDLGNGISLSVIFWFESLGGMLDLGRCIGIVLCLYAKSQVRSLMPSLVLRVAYAKVKFNPEKQWRKVHKLSIPTVMRHTLPLARRHNPLWLAVFSRILNVLWRNNGKWKQRESLKIWNA